MPQVREVAEMRRAKLQGAVERALLGAAMSLAAMVANWVLTRRMARRKTEPGG